ncbi:unnamed protein product, partial [Brassica oleracea]
MPSPLLFRESFLALLMNQAFKLSSVHRESVIVKMMCKTFVIEENFTNKMEAIDLNADGQNDVMDEDIEDHEVIEISEANKGTQPRSRRRVSRGWR